MKVLLSIVELGGYPDFTGLYERLGFKVIKANSMRKALTALKKQPLDVIVAEFIYGPTYGSQLSNFESLFAALQRDAPSAHLIAFLDKENASHFDKLKGRFPAVDTFFYPINENLLTKSLKELV